MKKYKCLNKNIYNSGKYKILPLRFQDRYDIMNWRNEQKYHLRQQNDLKLEIQDLYFENVINNLFKLKFPKQILFSYLEDDKCIGYGGLVHVNWKKKDAEISFIMDTVLEDKLFDFHWSIFLNLIEKVAFNDLRLIRIFTHAYNLRPHLYDVLLKNSYNEESKIKSDNTKKSEFVLVHSKISKKIKLIKANIKHIDIAFEWVNEPSIRKFSFNKTKIDFHSHKNWFVEKIKNPRCFYFFLKYESNICGSIRFDEFNNKYKISYLIDKEFQGHGLGRIILFLGTLLLKKKIKNKIEVYGDVKNDNYSSIKIFENLSFDRKKLNKSILRFQKVIT